MHATHFKYCETRCKVFSSKFHQTQSYVQIYLLVFAATLLFLIQFQYDKSNVRNWRFSNFQFVCDIRSPMMSKLSVWQNSYIVVPSADYILVLNAKMRLNLLPTYVWQLHCFFFDKMTWCKVLSCWRVSKGSNSFWCKS